MDVTDLHRRTVAAFVSRLDSVGDRWNAPTPCSDWDVRTLINHIAYEDLWTVPLMEGVTIAEVGDRFEGDLLGEDPVAAARAAADAATIAAASRLVREPRGPLPRCRDHRRAPGRGGVRRPAGPAAAGVRPPARLAGLTGQSEA